MRAPAGRDRSRTAGVWAAAVVLWSLVSAAPHLYWAAGGRGGLGAESRAADTALTQGWFLGYDLRAAVLARTGAAVTVWLTTVRTDDGPVPRWLRRARLAGALVLGGSAPSRAGEGWGGRGPFRCGRRGCW